MDLKTMQTLVAKGKMSRRDFIQLSIAAGVTVAAAEKMFVSAARAEPKKGGTFKVALGSGATTDGLDPALFPDTFNGLFGWGTLRSSLTEVDQSGKVNLKQRLPRQDNGTPLMVKFQDANGNYSNTVRVQRV